MFPISMWNIRIGVFQRSVRMFEYTVARVGRKRHGSCSLCLTEVFSAGFLCPSSPRGGLCGLGGEPRVAREISGKWGVPAKLPSGVSVRSEKGCVNSRSLAKKCRQT